MRARAVACVAATLGASTVAHADPLNPWGGRMPDGVAAVAPFATMLPDDRLLGLVYLMTGLGEHADAIVGVGAISDADEGWQVDTGLVEALARWYVTDMIGLVGYLAWSPGRAMTLGPAVHLAWRANELFALNANVGIQPFLSGGEDEVPAYLLVAPEVYVHPQVSFYLELDGGMDLRERESTLRLVPGVSVALDPARHHVLCLGVEFRLRPDDDLIGVGAWYSATFAIGGR